MNIIIAYQRVFDVSFNYIHCKYCINRFVTVTIDSFFFSLLSIYFIYLILSKIVNIDRLVGFF